MAGYWLHANVFNGSPQTEVEFRMDGEAEWHAMTWTNTIDPTLQQTYQRERQLREGLLAADVQPKDMPSEMSEPRPSTHLWKAALPAGLKAGSHIVEVRGLVGTQGGLDGNHVVGRRAFRVAPSK